MMGLVAASAAPASWLLVIITVWLGSASAALVLNARAGGLTGTAWCRLMILIALIAALNVFQTASALPASQ